MTDKYKTAVKKFYEIRDLPYHISTKGEKGSCCEEKAQMLINQLHWLGINARLRIGLFRWAALGLPQSIMTVEHDEKASHSFVEVKNKKGEWIFVDPTWKKCDSKIAQWDGINPTCLAMKCDKILSPEASALHILKFDYTKDLQKNGKFYEAINQYHDSFLDN